MSRYWLDNESKFDTWKWLTSSYYFLSPEMTYLVRGGLYKVFVYIFKNIYGIIYSVRTQDFPKN